MKSREDIEGFVAETKIGISDQRDQQVLSEVLQAHEDFKNRQPQQRQPGIRRVFVTYSRMRIAAIVALVLVLAGAFSFGGGSVAFSQAGHAMGSTLSRLKQMIADTRAQRSEEGAPPSGRMAGRGMSRRGGASGRGSTFTGKLTESEFWAFPIPGSTGDFQRFLKEQKIEPVPASGELHVNYATLDREQVERFLASMGSTVGVHTRIVTGDGSEAMLGSLNLEAMLALRTNLNDDGQHISSSFSYHNGQEGFEIPNFTVESGGAVLIYGEALRSAWSAGIFLIKMQPHIENP